MECLLRVKTKIKVQLTVVVRIRASVRGQERLELDLVLVQLGLVAEEQLLEEVVLAFSTWRRLYRFEYEAVRRLQKT